MKLTANTLVFLTLGQTESNGFSQKRSFVFSRANLTVSLRMYQFQRKRNSKCETELT